MKKLKINMQEKSVLSEAQMSLISGGSFRSCQCACYYRNAGGSSIEDNSAANFELGENGGHSHCHTQDEKWIVRDEETGEVVEF